MVRGSIILGMVAIVGQTLEVPGGGAGWASFGIAGLVLAWLLLVHLPAKDRQLREFIDIATKDRDVTLMRYDKERAEERELRHQRSNQYQATLNEMAASFKQALDKLEDSHKTDAEKDRAAFLQRNTHVEDAIKSQTLELKTAVLSALQGLCRGGQQIDDAVREMKEQGVNVKKLVALQTAKILQQQRKDRSTEVHPSKE